MPADLILALTNAAMAVVNLMVLVLMVAFYRSQRHELRNALHKSFLPVIINHIALVRRYLAMNADQLRDLKAAASAETAVDASVIALLNSLSQQLHDANNKSEAPNPEVQAIIDGMKAEATSLAGAVAVNTPSAGDPGANGGSSVPPPVEVPPAPVPTPTVNVAGVVTNDDGSVSTTVVNDDGSATVTTNNSDGQLVSVVTLNADGSVRA